MTNSKSSDNVNFLICAIFGFGPYQFSSSSVIIADFKTQLATWESFHQRDQAKVQERFMELLDKLSNYQETAWL